MRIPRRGNIRSHRARRRKIVAPWIVATTVTVLVVAVAGTGFYLLVRPTCHGEITATVVATPSTAGLLENVARGWADGQPVVAGKCASVDIEARDSASTVEALGQRWSARASGTAPDVWIPDSAVWARHAAANPVIAPMIPKQQPSLARTVSVIAMPRPMAERLGWPKGQLTWQSVLTDLVSIPNGWAGYGKPEWGPVRIGMSDPAKSTAALLALAAIADDAGSGQPTEAGLAAADRLKHSRAVYTASTDDILTELAKADRESADAALQYVSAFPALETDIYTYNQANPTVPLVAVYPVDGSIDADHPYLVLDAPWSQPDRRQVADQFLRYAQGSEARAEYLSAGFRDAKRTAGGDFTTELGVEPKVPTAPRGLPSSEAIEQALGAWAS